MVYPLAAALYLCVSLLERITVQRNGIVFILDLQDVGIMGVDSPLISKMLELVQADVFPGKVCEKVYCVNASFMVRNAASFTKSVEMLPTSQDLNGIFPRKMMPSFLGGTYPWTDAIAQATITQTVKSNPECARLVYKSLRMPEEAAAGPADVLFRRESNSHFKLMANQEAATRPPSHAAVQPTAPPPTKNITVSASAIRCFYSRAMPHRT